ncbi:MAG TPA: HEPN domain-containing protein [Candidatus Nanoarchaeia archaeon]|nr:HEPN domain-containing protein [Candidatus Nanoarchaeia archaeon]
MGKETENWWHQAEADFKAAVFNFNGKQYYVASFLFQQAVEKALKALMLKEKKELLKSHSLSRLAKELNTPLALLAKLAILEPVYQETRYPDVSEKIPAEEFEEEDASKFLEIAEEVMQWIRKRIK